MLFEPICIILKFGFFFSPKNFLNVLILVLMIVMVFTLQTVGFGFECFAIYDK